MEQLESLFDAGSTAWRLEIRCKGGGGPFDPAGFSIQLVDGNGALVIHEVWGCPSDEWPIAQLDRMVEEAAKRYRDMVGAAANAEAVQRIRRRG